jgi:hypothetical protein
MMTTGKRLDRNCCDGSLWQSCTPVFARLSHRKSVCLHVSACCAEEVISFGRNATIFHKNLKDLNHCSSTSLLLIAPEATAK